MSPGLPYWYLRPRRKKQHISPGHTLLSLSRSRPSHAHSFAATALQPQSQKEVFAPVAGSFPSTFSLLAPPATKQPKHFWSFFLTKPLPEIYTAPCCRFPTVFKGLLIPACTKNAERSLPHSSSPFPSVSQAAPVGATTSTTNCKHTGESLPLLQRCGQGARTLRGLAPSSC